jgi:hypothetical protein
MMALEEYTAHHGERAEEIMYRWPWRRFEGMFRRHLLRKAREELIRMRDLRIAAIDANMNWDSKENEDAKKSRVESYQKGCEEGIRILYSASPQPEFDQDIEDDPLFAPVKRRAGELREQINQPLVKEAGMGRQLLEVG